MIRVNPPQFVYRDLGMARIEKELELLDRGRVLVGWPSDLGSHDTVTHTTGSGKKWGKKGKRTKSSSNPTIGTIAVCHEFGIPAKGLPARPILGETNRLHSKKLEAVCARLLRAIYSGETLPSLALKRLGVFWEGRIKATFREGAFVPLKRSTIAAKGSSMPLIDSGQLRGSVTSKVEGL